jgi:hypothetical protein
MAEVGDFYVMLGAVTGPYCSSNRVIAASSLVELRDAAVA